MEEVMKFGPYEVTKTALDKFEYMTQFKVTRECGGKMAGFSALNTSANVNPRCEVMSKNPEFICSKCYAKQFMGYRKSCADRYALNYEAANKEVWKWVPDLGAFMWNRVVKAMRVEEFGDLGTVVQAINYLLVILANPDIMFGWWTKHVWLVKQAMDALGISELPNNLSLVGSSRKMNEVEQSFRKFPFVNHIFTVYRLDYCKKHGTETNCAALSCINCLRCYRKDGDFYINEMLKSDHQKKVKREKKNK